jgi:hypothetical protein
MANLQVAEREITGELERLVELSVSRGQVQHVRDAGLLHLRRREFAQAVDWLWKATNLTQYGKLYSVYYLAMAQQQLGDSAGAHASIREADRVRAHLQARFADDDFGKDWFLWLGTEGVRREAEAIVPRE